jgi:hypothetical protein
MRRATMISGMSALAPRRLAGRVDMKRKGSGQKKSPDRLAE